jgi:hypothetical protein
MPQPTDRSFKILKVEQKPSKINRNFYYLFFKGDTGKSFRTCLDPANRNFAHWKSLIRVGNVLTGLTFKLYNGSWIIDADSHPRLDHYEPLPADGVNRAPAKPDPVVVPEQPTVMQSDLFGGLHDPNAPKPKKTSRISRRRREGMTH